MAKIQLILDENQKENPEDRIFAELLSASKRNQVLNEGDVIEGVVVEMNKGEALVDFGGKSEGVIQGKELVDASLEDEIKVGASVLAVVLTPEDEEGRAILSIRRARAERKWREMGEKFENKDSVTVTVVQPNKGGLIVNAEGLQGFVPISQLGPTYYPSSIQKGPGFADAAIAYLTQFIGVEFDTQIIEFERETNRLILSERVLLQRTKGFEPLEELNFKVGDEIEGKVVAIKDFGIFVDLGTASGLVHISEMSWDRVNHPGDLVKMGQDVKVRVIGIDEGGRRVSLSVKQLSLNPWLNIAQHFEMGQITKGIVTKIVDYGAFVQLEAGFDGLVHISELSHLHVKDPADVLQEGQEADFKIILLDRDNQRLGLSYRQAQPDMADKPVEGSDKQAAPETETAAEVESEARSQPEAVTASPAADKPAMTTKVKKSPELPTAPEEEAPAAATKQETAAPLISREEAITELKQLDGVGAETAKALYEAELTTIEIIASAETAKLSLVPGVRRATAEKIKKSAEEYIAKIK